MYDTHLLNVHLICFVSAGFLVSVDADKVFGLDRAKQEGIQP
jgi:hypothetical protein